MVPQVSEELAVAAVLNLCALRPRQARCVFTVQQLCLSWEACLSFC